MNLFHQSVNFKVEKLAHKMEELTKNMFEKLETSEINLTLKLYEVEKRLTGSSEITRKRGSKDHGNLENSIEINSICDEKEGLNNDKLSETKEGIQNLPLTSRMKDAPSNESILPLTSSTFNSRSSSF